MSSEPGKKSSAALGQQANDSVFDFLYHDPLRIASFLGQFDPSGVAQSLKRTDQTVRASSDSSNDSLKFNAGIVSGNLGERIGVTESAQHGAERTYDPLWSNARAFLDYVAQRNMIQTDVYGARIGQFVLLKGDLSIFDIGMLKEGWTLPIFRQAAGITDVTKSKRTGAPNPIEFAFEMLGIMPHSIQAVIDGPAATAWATLKEDCLATSAGNLLLKHGLDIPGEWAMLGILDAQPDIVDEDVSPDFDDGRQMAAKLMSIMGPIVRKLLGRPAHAFGVTPLLIFREANG